MSNYLTSNERRTPGPIVASEVYRAVFNTFDPHIAVLDQTGRIIAVNAAWEQFARTQGDPTLTSTGIGVNYFDVCRRSSDRGLHDAARVLTGLQGVVTGELKEFTFEYPCHSPTEQRWFLMQATPLPDGGPGIVVTHTNVTVRKRAEMALQASEAEYRALFELSGVGTVEASISTGLIQRVNRKMCEFIGYTAQELVGISFLEITHPADRPSSAAALQQMVQGTLREYGAEKRYVRKDGQIVWGQITATIIRDSADQPVGIIAVIHDITERKHAEDERVELLASERAARIEAQAALQLRDTFLSIASHELKTPLTTMLGNAELLQRRFRKLDAVLERDQQTLRIIVKQGRRLTRLISSLLDLSRIEAGQLTIEASVLAVGALVQQAVEEIQPTLDKHTLIYHDVGETLLIVGDELRLEQVLHNLVGNAVKYSPSGGLVSIQVTREGARACIAITDQGIGIPASMLQNIFHRFYRASNTDALHIRGMGIGLFVVNEIVALHGGEITVASREGEGSTFRLYLPLITPATLP